MTKYGVNTTPKRVCKTHEEAYNGDEGCKWCEPRAFADTLKRVDDFQPETCPSLGTSACSCMQCQAYDTFYGMFP
jgi:hypothetical protein